MLKLNTGNLSNRSFFENLRGKDRRSLTELLCIMRDNGIKNVDVIGSSVNCEKGEYNDIDLICGGFNYNSLKELKKRGAEDIYISTFTKINHNKVISGNRYQFNFNGTEFDIGSETSFKPFSQTFNFFEDTYFGRVNHYF